MKNKNRRRISCLLSAVLLLVMSFGFGTFAGAEESDSSKPVVWIVGDSTVSAFTDNYYYPRYGWGTQIDKYLDGTFEVKNIALSGRSSTSYTADKEYGELIAGMKKGDFLLVGFGHNDEKAESGRYTNPNGDYKTAGSFANSLYENYIKPAQAAGTTVVLCTPIVRRTADGNWSDSQLHVTAASGEFEGGSYPQAIINLGKDLNVPVVDMTSLTKKLYDSLGASETVNLHAWTSSKPESVDTAALCGLAESPRVGLCSFFQSLVDVGGAVFGGFEGLHVQQGADGLDAAALLAHDGGVQGRVEGEAVRLCLHISPELRQLGLVLVRGLLAVELGEAVLRSLELGLCVFELGLELFGDGLLAVDVSAVFAHQPVQLFIGDAGELCLYVFTLHK